MTLHNYEKRVAITSGWKRRVFRPEELPKNVLTEELRSVKQDKLDKKDLKYGNFSEEEDKKLVAGVHELINVREGENMILSFLLDLAV